MLRLSWAVAMFADVMAHKLDASREEEALLQTERIVVPNATSPPPQAVSLHFHTYDEAGVDVIP